MTNSINEYVEYFRQIAVSHFKIRHNIAAENPDHGLKSESHFAIFEEDEVVTGLRSAIGDGISLFLECYTFNGKDNDAGDFRSLHHGRFLISQKTIKWNISEKVGAMQVTEEIVWDILNKIVHDSVNEGTSCGCPFKNVSLNDFSVEPVMEIWDGRSGWVVNFNFQQDRINIMDPARAADQQIWKPK